MTRMTVTRMHKKKYDQSHTAIILRVRQYFTQQLRAGKRHKLTQILNRTAVTTGFSRATISRKKNEYYVQKWPIESEYHVQVSQESQKSKISAIIVQKLIRNIF